jgi:hypothetical protein
MIQYAEILKNDEASREKGKRQRLDERAMMLQAGGNVEDENKFPGWSFASPN